MLGLYSNRSENASSDNILTIPNSIPLNLIRAGYYNYSSESLGGRTTYGGYWSNHYYLVTYSRFLYFFSIDFDPQSGANRGFGMTLRCLARWLQMRCGCELRTLPALLLILYVPKVGDYRGVVETNRMID